MKIFLLVVGHKSLCVFSDWSVGRERAFYESSRGELFFIILLWIFSKIKVSVLNGLKWAFFANCLVRTIVKSLHLWFFLLFFKASKMSVFFSCPKWQLLPHPLFILLLFPSHRLSQEKFSSCSGINTIKTVILLKICPLTPVQSFIAIQEFIYIPAN